VRTGYPSRGVACRFGSSIIKTASSKKALLKVSAVTILRGTAAGSSSVQKRRRNELGSSSSHEPHRNLSLLQECGWSRPRPGAEKRAPRRVAAGPGRMCGGRWQPTRAWTVGRGGHFHVGSPMAFGPAGRAGDCPRYIVITQSSLARGAPGPGPLASINPRGLATDSSRILYTIYTILLVYYMILLIAYASSIWNSIANG
jgi:hypothetical protein